MDVWQYLNKISIIITIFSFCIGFFSGKKYEKSEKKTIKNIVKKVSLFFSNNNNVNIK